MDGLEAEVMDMTINGCPDFLLLDGVLESGVYVKMEHIRAPLSWDSQEPRINDLATDSSK